MNGFIARQPNGLLCQFSLTQACPTSHNVTNNEYLNGRIDSENSREARENTLENFIEPFSRVLEEYVPLTMSQEDFDALVATMSYPVAPPARLIRINKLSELLNYEDPNTTHDPSQKDVWTKNVHLILVHRDGYTIPVKKWLYKPDGSEFVYNRKKNYWAQGDEHYDIGKSHIAHIYVVTTN